MLSQHTVGVFVFDGVTLLDIAGPVEVFNEANRFGANYRVELLSEQGAPVRSSSGITLATDGPVTDGRAWGTALVPGSDDLVLPGATGTHLASVRSLTARTERVASVCTGAFLLAAAGLLDGRRATTHWRHADQLARRHPRITVEPDALYVTDGPISSSAGVSAGIDLALALVESDHGQVLAREVARSLVVFLQRPGGQSQFSVASRTPMPPQPTLRAVLELIAADPAGDHTVPRLAAQAATSTRHLTRLFRQELATTPARYVERVRVEAAQNLLEAGHGVGTTARLSGFGSEETLRRVFLAHLGVPPATYQRRFATAGVRPTP